MNAKEIFELCIKKGIDADPRGKAVVKKQLQREKKAFENMDKEDKKFFDKERLWNPYADSRMLCGDEKKTVKRILMGINIDTAEVLLADRLSEKGKKIDLIVAHHPRGSGLANLYDVMHLQDDFFAQLGIPINVSEQLTAKRIAEVERRVLPVNHYQAVDAARLLGYSMMCLHSPADNHVQKYVQETIDKAKPETVGDVIKALKKIPEYQEALRYSAAMKMVAGKKSNRCGKVVVKMTGGTEGAKELFEKMSIAGVGTFVCMHLSDDQIELAKKANINVLIAGHICSDSIGMNLMWSELEKKGIEVVRCSGIMSR
jgi:putative NIF3 family GTP cyclohydrolase 1 type 2